jgi:glycosyltransferase involved in cell wall biosynthesis
MRILFLSHGDRGGGAAIAASRLMSALRQAGHVVRMLVQERTGEDPDVQTMTGVPWRWRRRLDRLPLVLYPRRSPEFFSCGWLPDQVASRVHAWRPDLVHVHWINNGFVASDTLADLRLPQVWTLHDSWAFTGGCHYHDTCSRFTTGCGSCPVLGSHEPADLSRLLQRRKLSALVRSQAVVITPSRWLQARLAATAAGGRVRSVVIPNVMDRGLFRITDRSAARQRLGLPVDTPIIVFAALQQADRNKGADLLAAALKQLPPGITPTLVTAGLGAAACFATVDLPQVHLAPRDSDAAMADLLAAATVVAVPSRCENLPYAVAEALACGVFTVAFAVGGIPEQISHGETGWLACPFDVADYARGLARGLAARPATDGGSASVTDPAVIQHEALYQDVCQGAGCP